MPTPRLSFIVLNLNGGPLLREALQSIERQTFTDYEVLVVDNGSYDRSWDLQCLARPGWYLLRLETNRGFSEGNNIAFARATGAVIALINNDVILDPDWAARIMDAFADPQVAFAACRLVQRRHPERLDSAGFDLYACITTKVWMGKPAETFTDRNHDPFGPVAAAAAYRRSALEETGLFHPEYFAYYEDTDLAIRLVLFGQDAQRLPALPPAAQRGIRLLGRYGGFSRAPACLWTRRLRDASRARHAIQRTGPGLPPRQTRRPSHGRLDLPGASGSAPPPGGPGRPSRGPTTPREPAPPLLGSPLP
jgi:glycosyltransferase involved in cell wall biosynthesis